MPKPSPIANCKSPIANSLAWQGWQLQLPSAWNPVRIEGDYDKGSIIFADLHKTRLALRWSKVRRRFDFDRWPARVITGELGASFVEKIRRLDDEEVPDGFEHGHVFEDDDPPGRDVFLAHSTTSGRLVEVIYPTDRVSKRLLHEIVPTLSDQPADAGTSWSIFDLGLVVPAKFRLDKHRLHAGDMALTFVRRRETLVVRQVTPATLALAREPLERFLERHARLWKAHYKPTSIETRDDGSLRLDLRRRRRIFFARWLTPLRTTLLQHDQTADRVIVVDAESEEVAQSVLGSTTPTSPADRV